MRRILFVGIIVCAGVMLANDEYRLVDKLVAAQREVEKANASGDKARISKANRASEKAGDRVVEYCNVKGLAFAIKPNGLMGCVPHTGNPPAPRLPLHK